MSKYLTGFGRKCSERAGRATELLPWAGEFDELNLMDRPFIPKLMES